MDIVVLDMGSASETGRPKDFTERTSCGYFVDHLMGIG